MLQANPQFPVPSHHDIIEQEAIAHTQAAVPAHHDIIEQEALEHYHDMTCETYVKHIYLNH